MADMKFRYRVFGRVFGISRPIEALAGAKVASSTKIDVKIVDGPVDCSTASKAFLDLRIGAGANGFVITVDEVGSFAVSKDCIVFDRYPGATDHQVDAYLLGSAFGTVMHIDGILPLHSNGIVSNGKAALVCGASGAGKSTLAAYCNSAGFHVLSDDLCAIEHKSQTGLIVHPGIPRLKLWQNSLHHLALSNEEAREVPWADGKYELVSETSLRDPCPLAAIYVLPRHGDRYGEALIEPIGTLPALNAITSNIYRRPIADLLGQSANYLKSAVRLTKEVPIFSVNRRWGLDHFDEEAADILAHIEEVCLTEKIY